MNFDTCKWPVSSTRCVLPGCDCRGFKPGASQIRQCEGCRHGWVAHVLAKLSPLPLVTPSHLDGLTSAIAYDVTSMILLGTHAIPVNLKILLDRLIPAHLQNDLTQVMHDFGWTFQDYSRGYMLLDNLGHARDSWVTCRREEEPVILQQFLRFYDTRALAYEMLLTEATLANSALSQSQRISLPPGGPPRFPGIDHPTSLLDFRQLAVMATAAAVVNNSNSNLPKVNDATATFSPGTLPQTLVSMGNTATSATVNNENSAALFPLMLSDLASGGGLSKEGLQELSALSMSRMLRSDRHDNSSGEAMGSAVREKAATKSSSLKNRRNTITSHFNAIKRLRPNKPAHTNNVNNNTRRCVDTSNKLQQQSDRLQKHRDFQRSGGSIFPFNQLQNSSRSLHGDSRFEDENSCSQSMTGADNIPEDGRPTEEDDRQTVDMSPRSDSPSSSDAGILIEGGLPVSTSATHATATMDSETGGRSSEGVTSHLRGSGGGNGTGPTTATSFSRNKKRVLCTTCNKSFCDKGALKIHYSAVHLREMHKCTIRECSMWFSSRRSRNRHSANPNPRLHMTHSTKKLPDNAVIVDDGTGRAMGERLPIPNSVLNPPIVSTSARLHRSPNHPHHSQHPHYRQMQLFSSNSELLNPPGDNLMNTPNLLKQSVSDEDTQQELSYSTSNGSHGSNEDADDDTGSQQPINLVLDKTNYGIHYGINKRDNDGIKVEDGEEHCRLVKSTSPEGDQNCESIPLFTLENDAFASSSPIQKGAHGLIDSCGNMRQLTSH